MLIHSNDKNNIKVEKSIYVLERPCKYQIVTDIKSRNTSQIIKGKS